MPAPQTLVKAKLQPITWDEQQTVETTGDPISVQFNPESLKVAYSNKSAGGDQRGGSAVQFVGSGTTKLSLDLWFDVNAPEPDRALRDGTAVDDVRLLTEQVVAFIDPKPSDEDDKYIPPGMRFLWGSFLFDGVVDSINESLDFFSEQGKPLRARVSVALSQQKIQFQFTPSGQGTGESPATEAQTPVRDGDSVQQAAAREGRQDEWQDIANANDVENPRNLPAGQPLDLRRPGRR